MSLNVFWFSVAFLAFGIYLCVKLRHATHMFQLNGYFPGRFQRWLGSNHYGLRASDLLPAFAFIFVLLGGVAVGMFMLALGCALAATKQWRQRRDEKKPLVVTARVKRLWMALGTIHLIVFGIAYPQCIKYLSTPAGVAITLIGLSLWCGATAYILITANFMIAPVEALIRNRYVADAKRILVEMPSLTVVGITGSFGKTSTKHILNDILSESYNVLMTPASYNTTLGVVRAIRELLRPQHTVFLVEMGARLPGDIQEICDLVKPRFGILTGIAEQHLETFKSIDNIVKTKTELIESLPAEGIAFLNDDNPYLRAYTTSHQCVRYGLDSERANCRATNVSASVDGSVFTVTVRKGETIEQETFTTRILGRHNIGNILAATAVACTLGMPLKTVARAVRKLQPVEHRLQLRKHPNNVLILDDAYNANPVGANAALEVLGSFEAYTRVLITPGMVELGEQEAELNRAFGRAAAGVCDHIILVGPKRTQPIQEGLNDNAFPPDRTHVVRNLKEGLEILRTLAVRDCVTLFENDLPDNFAE